MNDFHEKLRRGQAGESLIAKWAIRKGAVILPVYEKIMDTGKGPQLFTAEGQFVAPDLLHMKGGKITWIEAKTKTAFTYYRKTGKFVTGIDLRHYKEYQRVRKLSSIPVWLMFLQEGGVAKDHPDGLAQETPKGLFGNNIDYLMQNESHQSENYGRGGMVYWSLGSLYKIADYHEVIGEAA